MHDDGHDARGDFDEAGFPLAGGEPESVRRIDGDRSENPEVDLTKEDRKEEDRKEEDREEKAWEEDWDEEDWNEEDTAEACCPRCGDDTGSCVCFVVLLWEGEWLRCDGGDIECSSLDRVLRWGHGLSLAQAPPSRNCDLLAGLPESLAADIESYWLDIAAKVDAGRLDGCRASFLAEAAGELDVPNGTEGLDPSDARHPWHSSFLEELEDHFDEDVIREHSIRMKRIDVHCTWAGICAEETSAARHRSEGVGCSSIWDSLSSPDPSDTWRRMEAMLEPVLTKLDAAGRA